LSRGCRTADMAERGVVAVGTEEMGDRVLRALEASH